MTSFLVLFYGGRLFQEKGPCVFIYKMKFLFSQHISPTCILHFFYKFSKKVYYSSIFKSSFMSKLLYICIVVILIIFITVSSQDKSVSTITETPKVIEQIPVIPEASKIADMIEISSPLPNGIITSPIQLSGRARGNWYFEASFPIELQDNQGNVIAVAIAQAQGDWMTEDFVPFSVNLTFAPQVAGSKGQLVFKKDNPSGMPENDASLIVPVQF